MRFTLQRMAARGSTFELYNRAVGGDLADRLRGWREQRLSLVDITRELATIDVIVDPSTVHRWCNELGIRKPAREGIAS